MAFKHPQPFTLAQVSELDVSVLAEEITRLQNSLNHLRSTQNELQLLVDTMTTPDDEFMSAIQENKDVIDSQEERISILRSVLANKGRSFGSHYDLPGPERTVIPVASAETVPETATDDGDGVHL